MRDVAQALERGSGELSRLRAPGEYSPHKLRQLEADHQGPVAEDEIHEQDVARRESPALNRVKDREAAKLDVELQTGCRRDAQRRDGEGRADHDQVWTGVSGEHWTGLMGEDAPHRAWAFRH